MTGATTTAAAATIAAAVAAAHVIVHALRCNSLERDLPAQPRRLQILGEPGLHPRDEDEAAAWLQGRVHILRHLRTWAAMDDG